MRRLVLLAVFVCALGLMAAGCGEGPVGKKAVESSAGEIVFASSFQDGVEPLYPNQFVDPVSGKQPIKQEFYVDVEGKRVYFNSAESRDQFQKDPSKYMDALRMSAGQ